MVVTCQMEASVVQTEYFTVMTQLNQNQENLHITWPYHKYSDSLDMGVVSFQFIEKICTDFMTDTII